MHAAEFEHQPRQRMQKGHEQKPLHVAVPLDQLEQRTDDAFNGLIEKTGGLLIRLCFWGTLPPPPTERRAVKRKITGLL